MIEECEKSSHLVFEHLHSLRWIVEKFGTAPWEGTSSSKFPLMKLSVKENVEFSSLAPAGKSIEKHDLLHESVSETLSAWS